MKNGIMAVLPKYPSTWLATQFSSGTSWLASATPPVGDADGVPLEHDRPLLRGQGLPDRLGVLDCVLHDVLEEPLDPQQVSEAHLRGQAACGHRHHRRHPLGPAGAVVALEQVRRRAICAVGSRPAAR